MALHQAIQDVLKAFDNGIQYGDYDPDLVCDSLEVIAGEAMDKGGNAAFLVGNLIQAGRNKEALFVLAKEVFGIKGAILALIKEVAKTNSTKTIQAMILLAQALSEEEDASSGPRKFRRPESNAPRRNGGQEGARTSERPSTPPPAQPRHAADDPSTGEPRWTSTMSDGNGSSTEQPYQYPASRPMPPVSDNPPRQADVPTYGTQYPQGADQSSGYAAAPQRDHNAQRYGRSQVPIQEPQPLTVRRAPEAASVAPAYQPDETPLPQGLTEEDLVGDLRTDHQPMGQNDQPPSGRTRDRG